MFARSIRSLTRHRPGVAIATILGACVVLVSWTVWLFAGSLTVFERSDDARLEAASGAHEVASTVTGRVIDLRLALGARVRAGDVLAELDAGPLRAQLDRVRAEAAAEADTQRRAALTAAVAEFEDQLAQRTIRAPVSGSIAEVGRARPGSVVTEGERLATVVPDGELIVVARFAPSAAGRLRPGQSAQLQLDGFPPGEYGAADAIVTRVGTELRDGLVQVELTLAHGLPSGIPARHGLHGAIEVRIESASPASLLHRATGARAADLDAAPADRGQNVRARP